MALVRSFRKAAGAYNSVSLIARIVIGIIAGTVLSFLIPGAGWIGIFGELFVGALKAVAPFLVLVLVTSALCRGSGSLDRRFGTVIFFYLTTTVAASTIAVLASAVFPQTLALNVTAADGAAPSGIGDVMHSLLRDMIANPLTLLMHGKYIGILFWAVIFGFALKFTASEGTKTMLSDVSDATSRVVRWVINCAPFGIMGLVYDSVSSYGMEIFTTYGKLVLLLVGCMLFVALVSNPLFVWLALRRNPYPLVWRCLRESGVTAFFTRSS
ncbi:MAG: serine/threonine transporter SstT, partial [Mailhella sp.]|nr:serine/threonine transporter SstT [Mailhella sp.]